ncbi:MAG: UDP-3-O-(3-hydroxymyristoyl)glucosamine N-acyltransferase [Granulosicoccus sp.]|nr:UDP-3-O-(3-hydroxymyristoyl)glucosamine N-acyltransferase [Granulosicoccus sp.]
MKLGQLADALALSLHGDAEREVEALAPLERAGHRELSFIVSRRYLGQLAECKAAALIIPSDIALDSLDDGNYLVSDNPYGSYAKASWLLKPVEQPVSGVHPTASIHQKARISELASIGPGVVVGAETEIADHVRIDAHCVIDQRVCIGSGTRLFPGVCIYNDVVLGSDCRVQSGAVLGSEGFGYARTENGWAQIQQTGGLTIGNRVHIGANSTIDCGAIDPTVIRDGVIIDNQVQIAHNVQIDENTAIAGCVGIAGSTKIGKACQIGGACNIVGHLTIADNVTLNAASLVTQSIAEPGRYGSGTPLFAEHAWRRSFVNLGKLDALVKRVRRLERSSPSIPD